MQEDIDVLQWFACDGTTRKSESECPDEVAWDDVNNCQLDPVKV